MAKTKLYTGSTGCGKTYKALTEATSFVIAVPCRQLAYEIYFDYPTLVSRIDTGEVHVGPLTGNHVCVYENLTNDIIAQDTLIIDEAHNLNDGERGGALFQKILTNRAAGKEIILLTATDTLSQAVKKLLDVEEYSVQPFCEVPTKIELDVQEFCEKVKAGMRTIVFTKYAPNEATIDYYALFFGINRDAIRSLCADTPSFERVQSQLDFKHGVLQVVLASNVLAQGLNFPAEGVLIEYNEWDNWEIITQKIGRIARPLFGMKEAYYCLQATPKKSKHYGIPVHTQTEAIRYHRFSNEIIDISGWGFSEHELPTSFSDYSGFKYAHHFLRELNIRLGSLDYDEQKALDYLESQSELLRSLLETRL